MHRRDHAVFGTGFKIASAEEPFEQQNGLTHTSLAQHQRIGQVQQGEAIGNLLQCFRDPHQSMTVGIRLDHGPCTGLLR